jgi:hypothetical protein
MRRPVAKVEGSGFESFEGISAGGDVFQMHLCAAPDDWPSRVKIALANEIRDVRDGIEEGGILKTGDLYCFTKTFAPVTDVE